MKVPNIKMVLKNQRNRRKRFENIHFSFGLRVGLANLDHLLAAVFFLPIPAQSQLCMLLQIKKSHIEVRQPCNAIIADSAESSTFLASVSSIPMSF